MYRKRYSNLLIPKIYRNIHVTTYLSRFTSSVLTRYNDLIITY